MMSEVNRLQHENMSMVETIKVSRQTCFPGLRSNLSFSYRFEIFIILQSNKEKIKMHKQLPYLVSNVVEVRPTNAPFSMPPQLFRLYLLTIFFLDFPLIISVDWPR